MADPPPLQVRQLQFFLSFFPEQSSLLRVLHQLAASLGSAVGDAAPIRELTSVYGMSPPADEPLTP